MADKYARWQMANVENAMKFWRVLLLPGTRQCDKTTLAKELVNQETEYRTLDDLTLKKAAENDPHGFIKHTGKTLIIDEVQRAPDLLPAIKKALTKILSPANTSSPAQQISKHCQAFRNL